MSRRSDFGVEGRETAGGGGVLVVCRERPGQRQQLLVVAAAASEHRPDERRIDRNDSLLLAVVVEVELERRGVDEDDRVASRFGGGDESGALAGGLDVRDTAERAVGRAAELVGGPVRDRHAVGTAEQEDPALARDLDLADRCEAGDDRRPGRRGAAGRATRGPFQLVRSTVAVSARPTKARRVPS